MRELVARCDPEKNIRLQSKIREQKNEIKRLNLAV